MVHDAFWFAVQFWTMFTIVGLAVGGLVVAAYLLFAPVRKSLDRRMDRHDAAIWADTLAFVDAEKERYQQAHRKAPRRWTDRAAQQEPAFNRERYGQAVEDEYAQDVLPF